MTFPLNVILGMRYIVQFFISIEVLLFCPYALNVHFHLYLFSIFLLPTQTEISQCAVLNLMGSKL